MHRDLPAPSASRWAAHLGTLFLCTILAASAGLPGSARAEDSAVNLGRVGAGSFFITGTAVGMTPYEQWYTPTPTHGHEYQNEYGFAQEFVRVGLGYHFDSGVTAYAEALSAGLFNLPTNAKAPYPQGESGIGATYYDANRSRDALGIFLKQAYISLDPAKFGGFGLVAGRYEFNDGTEIMPDDPGLQWLVLNRIQQRLIGSRFVLVGGRSLDGAKVTYGDATRNVTLLYGVPTQGAYLVDGNNEINGVDVAYLSFNAGPRALPGWLWERALARLFLIHYDDTRGILLPDNQSLAQRMQSNGPVRITTLGGNFLREFAAGPGEFDLLLWGATQFGSWGTQTQSSYSYNAEIGYHWLDGPWKPWLRGGYTVASGDHSANNNTHSTFFEILPTPWYFANFAFYDMQNINDAMLELLTFPTDALQWRVDLHNLSLNSKQDLWYAGGGAWNNTLFGYQPRPSHGAGQLATVLESAITWKVAESLSLSWYLGRSFGGSVVAANYPYGKQANFGFMMAIWRL